MSNKRYRITRSLKEDQLSQPTISLEEAKQYFSNQPDFTYTSMYTVSSANSGTASISIEGDFFLWSCGERKIPFRHYEGELYVSGTDEAVIPKMQEIASELEADIVEG